MSAAAGKPQHVRDLGFERQMLLARLRVNLEREVIYCAAELRREGAPVNAGNLEALLIQRIATARPKSRIIPWCLADEIVEAATHWISRNFCA